MNYKESDIEMITVLNPTIVTQTITSLATVIERITDSTEALAIAVLSVYFYTHRSPEKRSQPLHCIVGSQPEDRPGTWVAAS